MTHPPAAQPPEHPRRRVVYLHVGAPKTGTTYLQAMLHAHRDQLRRDGCFYPRTRLWAHHDEARDLRNARPGGFLHPQVPGSWDRLVHKVQRWQGSGAVVISSELLAFATAEQARRAVESLQPAEVHLVLTLRDLVRQVPAVWQETVKNRSTMTYEEFLRRLVDGQPEWGPRRIWDGQDPTRILATWAGDIPDERVHLVTVPPRGADSGLLWDRFARVLGVDPARYSAVNTGANTSLGVAETEVVRRLNEQLQDAPWPFYARHLKNGIAQGVIAGMPGGARLVLPESALPVVEARTKQILAAVSARGYDVAGDLDDLLPPSDGSGVGPMPEPEAPRLAEASALAAGYLAAEFARSARGAHTARQPAPNRRELVKRRLVRLSDRYPAVDLLRRGYRVGRRVLR